MINELTHIEYYIALPIKLSEQNNESLLRYYKTKTIQILSLIEF